MSATETPEAFAAAIAPTVAAIEVALGPVIQRASEHFYEQTLSDVQQFLKDNVEWNLGNEITRCREIERVNRELLEALHGLNGILGTAESNASGTPQWEFVSSKINAAREAITKATGAAS